MNQEILETKNLTKKYNSFVALNDVSLKVEKGGIYGLIGQNGAGKTTLFKLIMGLAKVTDGEILMNKYQDLNKVRSEIGFMIGTSFFPYLSGKDNINYYRNLKGIKDKEETTRVLKLVGLYGEKKPFKAYSLGMKQRLGIANALLGNPKMIILDEPINGLDPQGILNVRNLIKKLNQDKGITFILSSHILGELDLVATKFGIIDHGYLIKEITYEELHKQTSKALIIKVDKPEIALKMLISELKIKDYELRENKIILNEKIEESNKITKLLVDNNFEVFEIKKQERTLEEYFINLVGGNKNA